ncbi:LAMI_0H07822g1_1 [Lachancea mirantina]|uniref:LAMI_0H07822g1_1 n=1 Tax=Lachancea mirantina TaxID=1230905 RepID=A0A1G4KFQ0_9SACH|nr:LAMI_0H07822g1_1 [Lachancea mirantina]
MGDKTTRKKAAQAQEVLDNALKFRREKIVILNADPSQVSFVLWFVISGYFPVIAACLGPIANMIAIAGTADKWRINENGFLPDPPGVFAMNVISLVLGCASNLILLVHFARKVSYVKAQILNITGWSLACLLLLCDLVFCSKRYFETGISRTIGFWYAVFTVIMYGGCVFMLLVHFIGYKLSKYPATFNLSDSERNVMIFTFTLSVWFMWGSAMFSQLMNISFGEAMYFCTITVLTIGLGDVVPLTVAGRIMTLIFAMTGLIILGLIVAMTRAIIQGSSGPVLFFHGVEMARIKAYERLLADDSQPTGEEVFQMARHIRRTTDRRQTYVRVAITAVLFSCFWLIGGVVFLACEGWNYFESIYFCFLCLITIGYGDFAPSTGPGRAFMVMWGVGAVPVMTAIISTMGETLFSMADSLKINFVQQTQLVRKPIMSLYSLVRDKFDDLEAIPEEATDLQPLNKNNDHEIFGPKASNTSNIRSETNNPDTISARSMESFKHTLDMPEIITRLTTVLEAVEWLQEISDLDDSFDLSYEQWQKLHNFVNREDQSLPPEFWLSEKSPLRYPLDQPRYASARLLVNLKREITYLLNHMPHDELSLKGSLTLESPKPTRKTLLPRSP